jgi:hypothetical protein
MFDHFRSVDVDPSNNAERNIDNSNDEDNIKVDNSNDEDNIKVDNSNDDDNIKVDNSNDEENNVDKSNEEEYNLGLIQTILKMMKYKNHASLAILVASVLGIQIQFFFCELYKKMFIFIQFSKKLFYYTLW